LISVALPSIENSDYPFRHFISFPDKYVHVGVDVGIKFRLQVESCLDPIVVTRLPEATLSARRALE
jgi:hypothetical protein